MSDAPTVHGIERPEEATYNRNINVRTSSLHETMAVGLRAHQAGHHREAQIAYRDVLGQDPNHVSAQHHLGLLLHQLGHYQDGDLHLQAALAQAPGHPDIVKNTALAWAQTGRLRESEALAAGAEAFPATLRRLIGVERASVQTWSRRIQQTLGPERGASAVAVYVKAHSRPAYLDRCLASIASFVAGASSVVVLDDGLTSQAVQRLQAKHGGTRFVRSLKAQSVDGANPDPLPFWRHWIGQAKSPFVLVLEEDCWFRQPTDLVQLTHVLREAQGMTVLLWERQPNQAHLQAPRVDWCQARPVTKLDAFALFPMANALYRTEYWRAVVDDVQGWTIESQFLSRAMGLFDESGYEEGWQAGRLCPGSILHGRHTTVRADGGAPSLAGAMDPQAINQALSEAWLDGELIVDDSFESDLADDVVEGVLRRRLSPTTFGEWVEWRAKYKNFYKACGVDLG